MYILANRIGVPEGNTGVVFEIVQSGEGATIERPEEEPDEDDEEEHPGDVDEEPDEDNEEADEDE